MSLRELATDTAKLAPPATVVTAGWTGAHVPELIQLCTLIYAAGLAIQTCYRFWHWWQKRRLAKAAAQAFP